MTPLCRSLFLSAAFVLLPDVSLPAGEFSSQAAEDSTQGIHRTVPLHYPMRMLREGVKHGEVRVLVQIDPAGKLTDSLAIAYTEPAFAEEVLQTIKQWRFEPLRRNGEVIGSVLELSVTFKIDGVVAVERMDAPQASQLSALGDDGYQSHGSRGLDRIPTPYRVVAPVYPPEWRAQGVGGLITVDFYIDETGGVRMPTVASNAQPLLGASAIAAVREWRFSPPVRRGQPALARVQQVFNFSPNSTP